MSFWSKIGTALALLNGAERFGLYGLIFLQGLLAFVDVIGLILFSSSIYIFANGSLPPTVQQIFHHLGIAPIDLHSFASYLILVTAFLYVIKSIFAIFFLSRSSNFLAKAALRISQRKVEQYFSKSVGAVDSVSSELLVTAFVSAIDVVILDTLTAFIIIVSESALLVLIIASVLLVNFLASSVVAIYFLSTFFFLAKFLKQKQYKISIEESHGRISSSEVVIAIKNTFREFFVYNQISKFLEKYGSLREVQLKAKARMRIYNVVPKYVYESLFYFGVALMLAFFTLFSSSPTQNSILVFFIASASRLIPSIIRIQSAFSILSAASGPFREVFSVIDEDEKTPVIYKAEMHPNILNSSPEFILWVKDLVFSHRDAGVWKLEIPEFTLKHGERILLYGNSGSGKSTFLDLLLGLHQDFQGSILLNGVEPFLAIRNFDNMLGYVPQKVNLIRGSIRENIALFECETDVDSKILEALKLAGLSDFVASLPEGLDTLIYGQGNNFSGGQVQRFGIARALFRDPKLLILDESTSALDPETETLVMDTISKLPKSLSIIFVSHKTDISKYFDSLYYFEDGQIRRFHSGRTVYGD